MLIVTLNQKMQRRRKQRPIFEERIKLVIVTMLKVIPIGHLRKLFGKEEIILRKTFVDASELLEHLNKTKSDDRVIINRENTLFFVKDVELSALDGLETKLEDNTVITLVPITHGG